MICLGAEGARPGLTNMAEKHFAEYQSKLVGRTKATKIKIGPPNPTLRNLRTSIPIECLLQSR